MIPALALALGAIVVGSLIGLWAKTKPSAFRPIHRFAIVAVGCVVLASILPNAMRDVGWGALIMFAAALLLPLGLEALLRKRRDHTPHTHEFCVELGYASLLVHQFIDGLGLGVFGQSSVLHNHNGTLLAVCLHTIPVTALFILNFAARHGTRAALLRSLGMVTVMLLGVMSATLLSSWQVQTFEAWLSAAFAGLLLHIVANNPQGLGTHHPKARRFDVIATLAALVFTLLITGVDTQFLQHFQHLSLQTAPALLLGLLLGALVQTLPFELPTAWITRGNPWQQASRAALIGAPLPLCSCGVLPVVKAMQRRGAGTAFLIAFLLVTPELGVETLLLTAQLFDWPFALLRVGCAIVLAILSAVIISYALRHHAFENPEPTAPSAEDHSAHAHCHGETAPPSANAPWWRRFAHALDELLHHIGPWILVGLISATYIDMLLPAGGIKLPEWPLWDVILLSLIALPSYVCATASTPLAAVLLSKGFSLGAVLAALLLGPATNIATLGFLRQLLGRRAMWLMTLTLVLLTWALGAALNMAPWQPLQSLSTGMHNHAYDNVLAQLSTGLLLLLLLRGIWKQGLMGWFGSLRMAVGKH